MSIFARSVHMHRVVAVFSSASPALLRVHAPQLVTRTDPVWVSGPVPLPAARRRPVSRSINNWTSSRLHKSARFLQSRDPSTRVIITNLRGVSRFWYLFLLNENIYLDLIWALTLFLIIKSLLLMKSYTWNKFHFLNSCNKYPRNRDDDKSYLIIKIIFYFMKNRKIVNLFFNIFPKSYIILKWHHYFLRFSGSPDLRPGTQWHSWQLKSSNEQWYITMWFQQFVLQSFGFLT